MNYLAANQFLQSLPASDLALLSPNLNSVELKQGLALVAAGEPLAHVYFPSSGFISLVTMLASGETLEVAMIGRDSFFGPMAALDNGLALNDAIVQLPGRATRIDMICLRGGPAKSGFPQQGHRT